MSPPNQNPPEPPAVRHHYVAQWHQRGFLAPGQSKLQYLDLHPEKIVRGGRVHYRTALRLLGPVNCFVEDNLYTLALRGLPSDVLERRFFGPIDFNGRDAVAFFKDYSLRNGAGEAHSHLIRYLDAQKLRSPRGLDYLRERVGGDTREEVLENMARLSMMHSTTWAEGVWEILTCRNSPTKFLLSDHPVAAYNSAVFPGSQECLALGGAMIERIGTRTLFPLDYEHLLVITNLQLSRTPDVNPQKFRTNPRMFDQVMVDLRKIQTGREIPEHEVLAVNYIQKMLAKRYIASADKAWLYPENHLKSRHWSKLGDRFFLHPDPRKMPFSTGIAAGGGQGPPVARDEYGHHDMNDPKAEAQRRREWRTFHAWREAWTTRYGSLPPGYDPLGFRIER